MKTRSELFMELYRMDPLPDDIVGIVNRAEADGVVCPDPVSDPDPEYGEPGICSMCGDHYRARGWSDGICTSCHDKRTC